MMENMGEQIQNILEREMHDRRYQLVDRKVKGHTSTLTDNRDELTITFNLKKRGK